MKSITHSNALKSLLLSKECLELANLLFKSEEHCKEFYIGFLGRNRFKIDDLLDYREHQISQSTMTLDRFLALCRGVAKVEVFEDVFFQRFGKNDIDIINETISQGEVTLECIYTSFESNRNKNIMRYVL